MTKEETSQDRVFKMEEFQKNTLLFWLERGFFSFHIDDALVGLRYLNYYTMVCGLKKSHRIVNDFLRSPGRYNINEIRDFYSEYEDFFWDEYRLVYK